MAEERGIQSITQPEIGEPFIFKWNAVVWGKKKSFFLCAYDICVSMPSFKHYGILNSSISQSSSEITFCLQKYSFKILLQSLSYLLQVVK